MSKINYFLKPTSYSENTYIKPHIPELKNREVPLELVRSFDLLLNWISALETNHLYYSAINYMAKDYQVKNHRTFVIEKIYPKYNLTAQHYPKNDEDSLVILPDHPFARHTAQEILKEHGGKRLAFTAAGRYQFIRSTWQHLVRTYHPKQPVFNFDRKNQDYLALCLVRESLCRIKANIKGYNNLWEYYIDSGYKNFDAFMNNKQVISALAMVWEAFEKFPDKLKSPEFLKAYEKIKIR